MDYHKKQIKICKGLLKSLPFAEDRLRLQRSYKRINTMSNYSLEPCFKVYDDKEGTLLEVRIDPDFPELILLHTPNKKSKEFYGDVRLSMTKKQAELLSEALTRQIVLMKELEKE